MELRLVSRSFGWCPVNKSLLQNPVITVWLSALQAQEPLLTYKSTPDLKHPGEFVISFQFCLSSPNPPPAGLLPGESGLSLLDQVLIKCGHRKKPAAWQVLYNPTSVCIRNRHIHRDGERVWVPEAGGSSEGLCSVFLGVGAEVWA